VIFVFNCPNFKKTDENGNGKCEIIQSLGTDLLINENKRGSICYECKKQWTNNIVPTIDNQTKIIQIVSKSDKRQPPIFQQAVSLGKSLIEWAYNGFQNVPPNEAELRLNICKENKCGMYDAEKDTCNACGCKISGTSLTPGKKNFSHEQCPAGLWPQLGTEIMNNAHQGGCRSCGS